MIEEKSIRKEVKKKEEGKEGINIYYVPSMFQVLSSDFWAHSYILSSQPSGHTDTMVSIWQLRKLRFRETVTYSKSQIL